MNRKNKLDTALSLIEQGSKTGAYPGAVVLIGNRNETMVQRVYGYRMVVPEPRKMCMDTIFDLASLTKPIACATSIMILHDQKKLDINQPVNSIIKSFVGAGKDKVTIKHLLTHTGGLPLYLKHHRKSRPLAFDVLDKYPQNVRNKMKDDGIAEKFFENVCAIPLSYKPGEKFIYTDWSYVILGKIVEIVSGKTLNIFAEKNIFSPLGMKHTFYLPSKKYWENCAATEYCSWRKKIVVGEVHDETAYLLNGVSGNAGLFSTGEDLAVFAQMMLNKGRFKNKIILRKSTVELMTTNHISSRFVTKYGLGWGLKNDNYWFFGNFSRQSYGHTGFTGTSVVIDPKTGIYSILLTNRVHPSRNAQKVVLIRKKYNTLAAEYFLSLKKIFS